MLEVPHEWSGIEETDGGNAKTGIGNRAHALLEYQFCAGDSEEAPAAPLGLT